MEKYIILFLFLIINISVFTQNNNIKNNNMITDVEITVSNKSEKNLIGGAVPVSLIIKNKTKQEILIALAYPNPWDLSFGSQSPIVKNIYEEADFIDARVPITKIPSGATYEFTYFLNRYFDFINEGTAEISYSLHLSVRMDSKQVNQNYEGSFSVKLVNPSYDEELKEEYAYYSNNLQSDDKKQRIEAAEALSFIPNPLCIPYIIPMLSIKDLEIKGIEALSHFHTDDIRQLMLNMLSHEDSFVVSAAIAALNSMNVPIPRMKFIEMLSSKNRSIVYIGLRNLALTPDIDDEEYIIPLLKDSDPFIAEEAKKYHSLLINKKQISDNQ